MNETIKSFLVGLGFGVDEASLSKFNRAIASATLKVAALYGAIKVTSAGIVYGLSEISQGFEKMGYEYKIIAPAINKALILRREMLRAYSAAGVNLVKVIQSSVKLNLSLEKTKYAFQAVYRSVASRFFDTLTRQSDLFRSKIYANMPKIQHVLEQMIKFIFKMLEATTALGLRLWSILTRVYDFFVKLDNATAGWSTIVLGVIAAWKLLNLGFLATPLGMLITGFTALIALWDDFKTFREGGESLINWGSETTKIMVGLAGAILAVSAAIIGVVTAYNLITNATKIWTAAQWLLNIALNANPIGLVVIAITALLGLITALDAKWQLFGGHVTGFFSDLGGRIMDFVGGPNVASNLQGGPGGVPRTNLGANAAASNQTNQHVQQQTNINVIGSADANAVGKTVAGEQGKVNFDMTRNLKGATR